MRIEDLRGKKIALLGMGENNRKLAEYLSKNNLKFKVIKDWGHEDKLVGKLQNLDIVFRTPGLRVKSRALQEAEEAGTVIYSQTKLFFDLCPAQVIGVTGTKGKGTTAQLIANILEKSELMKNPDKKVWLAGNIGVDPFDFFDQLKMGHTVVLELSSFQLQDLHKSPHVAVILDIVSEHQDYHEDFAEYEEAKSRIVASQTEEDYAVLDYDSNRVRNLAAKTPAKIVWNSAVYPVKPGCFVREGQIIASWEDAEQTIMPASEVGLLGKFNLTNVTAAVAAVMVLGVRDATLIRKVVSEFKGLAHRLEFVADVRGVKFYNDSLSTIPETAVAAIHSFEQPLILIVGGSDKKSDYQGLAKKISERKVKAILAIGKTGPEIAQLARKSGFPGRIVDEGLSDMEKVVKTANELAEAGDVVLLSPASASFDMFKDYRHRGELFKKFVQRL